MLNPLVSVVIPAYNCAGTIEKAIDSALSQNVDIEVIVVSDRSPDNLDAVLTRYSDDKRVIYLKNEKNLGAAESRNRGVRNAKGEFIAFLDADDSWVPDKLQKQLAVMKESDAVLCATARQLLTPEGVPTGKVIGVKETITYRDLLKHNSINCSSVLIRRDVALEFPMHSDDTHEDYIMWLEVLKKYHFAKGIDQPLLNYRLSNTGKSGSKLHSAKMTYQVYRKVGFSSLAASALFCRYALHGIWKYTFTRRMK